MTTQRSMHMAMRVATHNVTTETNTYADTHMHIVAAFTRSQVLADLVARLTLQTPFDDTLCGQFTRVYYILGQIQYKSIRIRRIYVGAQRSIILLSGNPSLSSFFFFKWLAARHAKEKRGPADDEALISKPEIKTNQIYYTQRSSQDSRRKRNFLFYFVPPNSRHRHILGNQVCFSH